MKTQLKGHKAPSAKDQSSASSSLGKQNMFCIELPNNEALKRIPLQPPSAVWYSAFLFSKLRDITYLSSAVLRQKRRRNTSPDRFIFISRVRILFCWERIIQPRYKQGSSIIQTVLSSIWTTLTNLCYQAWCDDLLMRAKTLFYLSNINTIPCNNTVETLLF